MAELSRRSAVLVGLLSVCLGACSGKDDSGPVTIGQGGNGQGTGGGAFGTGGGAIVVMPGTGGGSAMPILQTPVSVIITADNAYGFGYGNNNQLLNYFGGIENPASVDIFDCPIGNGPEQYTVPAADANLGNFLYIIGYADRSTTQGVIAEFFREGGQPVFTGMGEWQACATGRDFDLGSGGPGIDLINEQIAACNAGGNDLDTTSGGWVSAADSNGGRVVFGEDNTTDRGNAPEPGNEFRIACEIDAQARWMWYDWMPGRNSGSAFIWPGGNGNPTKDFVIFRLGAEFVPTAPR